MPYTTTLADRITPAMLDSTEVGEIADMTVLSDAAPLLNDDMTIIDDATIAAAPDPDDATLLRDVIPTPPRRQRSSADAHEQPIDIDTFHELFTQFEQSIAQHIFGKARIIRYILASIICGGHVLLEDEPGTGKTALAQQVARTFDLPFQRIQCTPDLLPSDILGATIYEPLTQTFSFQRGPIFASLILADELNRASAKTQAAFLECMEEQHVTVNAHTYDLPDVFSVIATQNASTHAGTYQLPRAQLDRFMIATSLGHPSHEAAKQILQRHQRSTDTTDTASLSSSLLPSASSALRSSPSMFNSLRQLQPPQLAISETDMSAVILRMRTCARTIHVADTITEYIVRIVESTRSSEYIAHGSSIRGALACQQLAQVMAILDGRDYVIPDDVSALAVLTLAHRIELTSDALFDGMTCEQVITNLVDTIPAPS